MRNDIKTKGEPVNICLIKSGNPVPNRTKYHLQDILPVRKGDI